MLSDAIQDYLKTIYLLQENREAVATSTVAARLGVTAPSVSAMLRKLAGRKLVCYAPYQGVLLTRAGERIALAVLRRHRILELYLARVLGYRWDQVHAEADRLEHAISAECGERLFQALGRPTRDPHGHPIPTRTGAVPFVALAPLAEVPVGTPALIAWVSDQDPAMLRSLGARGLGLGTAVTVLAKKPFGGPITVRSGNRAHVLGPALVRQIRVTACRTP
jgi:DtxR family transcriptional regulator, Mn-dependent transcriptional regulator